MYQWTKNKTKNKTNEPKKTKKTSSSSPPRSSWPPSSSPRARARPRRRNERWGSPGSGKRSVPVLGSRCFVCLFVFFWGGGRGGVPISVSVMLFFLFCLIPQTVCPHYGVLMVGVRSGVLRGVLRNRGFRLRRLAQSSVCVDSVR